MTTDRPGPVTVLGYALAFIFVVPFVLIFGLALLLDAVRPEPRL